MDYPTFGIPWSVFTQFHDRSFSDSGSVCTMSPPPSPMSPSPSLASSNDEESSFHFLPSSSSSSSSSHHVVVGGGDSLCHQVPAMLGLSGPSDSDMKPPRSMLGSSGSKTPGSRSGSSSHGAGSSNGFYKRLLEWLSRKKKSHRRYSEVVLPEHCPVDPHCRESLHGLMAVASAGRNQSAPMIFDITRPARSSSGGLNISASQRYSAARTNPPRIEETGPEDNRPIKSSSTSSTLSSSSMSSSSSLSSAPLPVPVPPAVTDRLTVQIVPDRLLNNGGFEAPPTTPTSSYSQAGIIQFEKQESEDKVAEIDAEWIIPWSDIQVGSIISQRGTCTINRGKWHGDVIIHQFQLQSAAEVSSFWSDVQSLSKLRHENLLLFMGIATEATSYTIVNSAPRGVSVANFRLGLKNGKPERIGMRAAVSISRQVAQATGYLHARGIVHGKLNPHNIFLEGDNYRVKLSLLDHGLVDTAALQIDYGCMPKMQVSYYSPELVRTMVVQPPEIHFSVQSTKFSDVYALGSFMYDLIAGSPPFHQEEVGSILWRIGNGQTTSLADVNCNARLKALMSSCWAYDATQRPSCVEVVRRLQPSALLCKSHSCSEPERLNRLGMCKLAC